LRGQPGLATQDAADHRQRLRDDLVASTRRRRYFDVVLWPRLSALAGPDLPRPAESRGPIRRGPSLAAIERLVTRIEGRP